MINVRSSPNIHILGIKGKGVKDMDYCAKIPKKKAKNL
jgi:hypothetical protein